MKRTWENGKNGKKCLKTAYEQDLRKYARRVYKRNKEREKKEEWKEE